jgi:uncharacterized protein
MGKAVRLKRSKKLTAVFNEAKRAFMLAPEGTLHGPGHWEQVEKNAIELAEKTPGCDVEVAILHDCKRQSEGADRKHGERAAEFARELCGRGMLGLDPERMALLEYAIRSHNGGMVNSDPTIGVCWDADRLDLPRVGTRPRAEMLSTRYAKKRSGAPGPPPFTP